LFQSPDRTLLARQGIYNKNGSVWAYELLYRNGDSTEANINNLIASSGDAATSSVISQLFTNLDMDTIIGNKRAFINFTYNHLIHQVPNLLPKNRIVIEVLETIAIDQLVIDNLIDLKQQGYKIALDDFLFREELIPLIEIADIIKIDVLAQNMQQIEEQLIPLRQRFNGHLLAEKIEDKIQFNNCIELGFDYFQGFFLNKPDPLKGQVITESKSNLLRLIAELNNDEVPIDRIEKIILQIPTLSYRILRLTNSGSFYVGRKIESLFDAINQLGLVQIRNWLSLLLLAGFDDVVPDLLERTLIRAKMCEHLAKISGFSNPHLAYTVGILSTLDAILNEPMASLLSKIQLSDALNEALLHHRGELGALLHFTIAYEEANFNQLDDNKINNEDLARSYFQGIEYANDVIKLIKE
jgi:EAL and modified HD-GYP domain-containing signal transduction protein